MMCVLMPTYTIRVTVTDKLGPTKAFWNGLDGKTGCDEVVARVREALLDAGLSAEVFFERFEHR